MGGLLGGGGGAGVVVGDDDPAQLGAGLGDQGRELGLGDGGDGIGLVDEVLISAATLRVLVVTATAPTVAQAYQARTISGLLSQWMTTLSPLVMPRAARPAARRRVAVRNSA